MCCIFSIALITPSFVSVAAPARSGDHLQLSRALSKESLRSPRPIDSIVFAPPLSSFLSVSLPASKFLLECCLHGFILARSATRFILCAIRFCASGGFPYSFHSFTIVASTAHSNRINSGNVMVDTDRGRSSPSSGAATCVRLHTGAGRYSRSTSKMLMSSSRPFRMAYDTAATARGLAGNAMGTDATSAPEQTRSRAQNSDM
mmetsp:Transcript_20837/g.41689  ORF Transcript_20837/g.41689 Transcript_20837/m.41689 type:complete len:203 (-) Transcript_20837:1161-1769(-)